MASDEDIRFGQLAVAQGYTTEAQLRECLDIQRKAQEIGLAEPLDEILRKKGYLTPAQVTAIHGPEERRPQISIPGYEILEKLGEGGMGAVFKARQISMDRLVAIKILRKALASDPSFIQRFQREARACAKLSHTNVVSAFDVGETQGLHYLIMEFVEGETLRARINRLGRLDERQALDFARQIARALAQAGKHRLIHRDIKPENILVTNDGIAKLADLGLAKTTDGGEAHLTQTGAVLGTPHYLSPEQALGKPCDGRSDLYSLGGTLFTLLTGRPPYEGPTIASILSKHLQEAIPSARALRPECSEGAEMICRHALAKNVESRYQTPEEMIADIDAVLSGQPPAHAAAAAGTTRPLSSAALAVGALGATMQAGTPVVGSPVTPASTPTILARSRAPASALVRSGPGTSVAAAAPVPNPPTKRKWVPYAVGAGALLFLLLFLVAAGAAAKRKQAREAAESQAHASGAPTEVDPKPPDPPHPVPPTPPETGATGHEGDPPPGVGPGPTPPPPPFRPGGGGVRFPLGALRSMPDLRDTVESLLKQRRYEDARAACDAALQKPALAPQKEAIERMRNGVAKVESVMQRATDNLKKTAPGTPITANGTMGKFTKLQEGRVTLRTPEGPVSVALHDFKTEEVAALFQQDPGMPPGKTALALGALYYAEGDYAKAVEEFRRAVKMGETAPDAMSDAERRAGERK